MLRTFLFVFLIALTISVSAQSVADLDTKDGFRTYKFGMARKAIPNLKYGGIHPATKLPYYNKTDEKLSIGPYPLQSISYVFYKDRLHSVYLKVAASADNCQGVYDTLTRLYGESVNDEARWTHTWEGKKVFASFHKTILETAYIEFISLTMKKQIEADLEAKKRNAVNDM
ncbi:hypothetical protein [Hymenobacter lapidiphilus]|uniref:hypothetical protein n=1 Tax=Hymenobacter sp. CCM 8763 TaxID=2303334 RepID=UPI001A92B176|nr:hypothetical protein [Hymenobacter sp. CCM 8763]